jgi:hypothetical protein
MVVPTATKDWKRARNSRLAAATRLAPAPEEEIVGDVDALLSDGSTWLHGHSFIHLELNRSQIGFDTNNKAFMTGGRRRLLEAASARRSNATNSTTGRASWTKFRTLRRPESCSTSRFTIALTTDGQNHFRCNLHKLKSPILVLTGSSCNLVYE